MWEEDVEDDVVGFRRFPHLEVWYVPNLSLLRPRGPTVGPFAEGWRGNVYIRSDVVLRLLYGVVPEP